jgi:hypothetical protein
LRALAHRRLLVHDAVDHRLLAVEAADTGAAAALLYPGLAGLVRVHLMQRPDRAFVRIAGVGAANRAPGRSASVRTLCVTAAASSRSVIVLPYDFDIFWPSRPGIREASVSSAAGSTRIILPVPSR